MKTPSPLVDDLALVLPELRWVTSEQVSAAVDRDAVERAAALIRAAKAPAIVGLNHLTIEALREAVALAEAMRGRLIPRPNHSHALAARTSVLQTATLGHVFASDLIIWVGRDTYPEDHPVAQAIAARRLLASFVDDTLDAVLALRDRFDVDAKHKRIAAVLPPHGSGDPRVASQWHKLAAQVQQRVRLCVFHLPASDAGNARGVHEVITWQTGVSPSGGVDFADGSPRACADTGADLEIFAGRELCVGAVRFQTPGLALGLAARVMRCDGVVLWLCDDPDSAPPDPMAALLAMIRGRL